MKRGAEQLYLGVTLGFLVCKGVTLLVNALTFPRLRKSAAQHEKTRVSLLVPARDEARNLARTLPGLLAQGAGEVLLLDDHSTDHTAALARQLGATVYAGLDLPAGWFGKSWACQQLAGIASGDLLIFTDADVRWHAGSLDALLGEFQRQRPDLLTVLPRPEGLTLGARFLTPLVDHVVLTLLPYPLLQTRPALLTTANGQVMAFRRQTYQRLGGHASVKGEMLEDTVFARQIKAQGGKVTQALGREFIGVQMYRSYAESVRGFSKNALGVHLNSRELMLTLALLHFATYTLPWLLPQQTWPYQLLRLASLTERGLVNLLTGRRTPADLTEGLLGPLTPLLALPGYRLALRKQVTWKGRTYRNP